MQRPILIIGLFACVPLLSGCAGSGAPASERSGAALRLEPMGAVSNPDGTSQDSPGASSRAAVIDGSVIRWDALHPALAEAAGRVVLEEMALDRALERAAARSGVAITEGMIRQEEEALLDELANVSGTPGREEILAQIRRARGLGPIRYANLLRRNATLRALTRADAEPSAGEYELARSIAFGETKRVRLFVSGSDAAAGRARSRALEAAPSQRAWVFAEACAAESTHPTAPVGGLIERMSAADPAYPDVLRDAIAALDPGGLSAVLATPGGFALVLVESTQAARDPSAGEIERVERRVRIRKQRIAMERMAQDLLARTSVSPSDPDLARAWRDR